MGRKALLTLLLALGIQVAQAEQYLVEPELWLEGVLQTVPVMVLEAGAPAVLLGPRDQASVASPGQWRLEVQVEGVEDPLAPSNMLWVGVNLAQFHEGDWELLADTMLGVPEGEPGVVSVVDGDGPASPETASVFLRLKTSRLRLAD